MTDTSKAFADLLATFDRILDDERVKRYKGTDNDAWAVSLALNLNAPRLNGELFTYLLARTREGQEA